MHYAWLIEDIQYLIIAHLAKRDLARLAQTCKALFDPAISQLWKTLTSLHPLVAALPSDANTRKLLARDLDRLDFYSSKIRNVRLEGNSTLWPITVPATFERSKERRVSWAELWEEIAALRPQESFIPNLQRFRVNYVQEEALLPFVGISGANLQRFYVNSLQNLQSDSVVRKILDQFGSTPRLNALFVHDGEPCVVPSRILEQSPLKRLRITTQQGPSSWDWPRSHRTFTIRQQVFLLSTVEKLFIALTPEWRPQELDEGSEKHLSSLKALQLDLIPFNIDACRRRPCRAWPHHTWICPLSRQQKRSPADFLATLDNPSLRTLAINFLSTNTSSAMFHEVVTAANRNIRLQQLTELALTDGGDSDSHSEPYNGQQSVISSVDLRVAMSTLLPLPHLRKLRLSAGPNFLGVADPELFFYKSVAADLPSLEILWFDSAQIKYKFSSPRNITDKVPIRNLAAFCSLLPRLVEIKVDLVSLSSLQDRRILEAWPSRLVQKLSLASWWDTDGLEHDHVLAFMQVSFPCLDFGGISFSRRRWQPQVITASVPPGKPC